MPKRPVIVHYHLFKNAGTSVDRVLRNNFSRKEWAEIEGANRRKLKPDDLIDYIRANPKLKAVSSHTAVVRQPIEDDIEILPIFFIRHPIDRIRSAYDFERKQVAQTPGAITAKKTDFKGYLEWRLSTIAPWQVSNFHAFRLKDYFGPVPNRRIDLFKARAETALFDLPFVGFVEDFNASMARFAEFIEPHFGKFAVQNVRENVSVQGVSSLEQNLEAFKERIGTKVYQHLEELNTIDFDLYAQVKSYYGIEN